MAKHNKAPDPAQILRCILNVIHLNRPRGFKDTNKILVNGSWCAIAAVYDVDSNDITVSLCFPNWLVYVLVLSYTNFLNLLE